MTDVDEVLDRAIEDRVLGTLKRALTNFKGTYFYERKVTDGNYGSTSHGISVQFDYAPDATDEEFFEEARRAAYNAKALVAQESGEEYAVDESGVLHRVLQEFPGATVVETEVAVRGSSSGVGPNPPYDPQAIKALPEGDEKKAQYKANSDWAEARFALFPREFWDNRKDKKFPNSFDYAHKDHKGVGFWVDKKAPANA